MVHTGVVDPDPHQIERHDQDPDPHQSDKLDPDPDQGRIRIQIRICIKVTSNIRIWIRIKVVLIRNTLLEKIKIKKKWGRNF